MGNNVKNQWIMRFQVRSFPPSSKMLIFENSIHGHPESSQTPKIDVHDGTFLNTEILLTIRIAIYQRTIWSLDNKETHKNFNKMTEEVCAKALQLWSNLNQYGILNALGLEIDHKIEKASQAQLDVCALIHELPRLRLDLSALMEAQSASRSKNSDALGWKEVFIVENGENPSKSLHPLQSRLVWQDRVFLGINPHHNRNSRATLFTKITWYRRYK